MVCSNYWIGLKLIGFAVGVKLARLAKAVEHGIFQAKRRKKSLVPTAHGVLGIRAAEYAGWIQVPWPVSVG
jgi:hypothetical protein